MGRIEVRDFDGDVAALAEMAYGTLAAERGTGTWLDLNRPEIARHLFAGVPDPRFLVGAYDGSRLVGFVANLPRAYRLNGKTYRGVASTMLAAHQDYRGAAVYLIAECLRRNREFGADLALFILEKGNRSWRMFERYLKPAQRIERLKTIHVLARVLDLDAAAASFGVNRGLKTAARLLGVDRPLAMPPTAGCVRPYQDTDLGAILTLIRSLPDQNALVRAFSPEALSRQLDTAGITATLVYEREGTVKGFVNFTRHELLSARGRWPWAWRGCRSWDGLDARERQALLAGLRQAALAQGCIGIVDWSRGGASQGSLYRARFLPVPLYIEMNAWVFNPELSLRGVRSIFEQIV